MSQSHKTLEFLQKLKDSGHWNENYDYSQVDYNNINSKVIVVDKVMNSIHSLIPKRMLYGSKCVVENCLDQNNYVITQFKNTHFEKYDYSLVNYVNNKDKVEIICKIHGKFLQSPNTHKQGANCPSCTNHLKKQTPSIIDMFVKIHGDKYDYSKVNYTNSKEKVEIICRIHGEFEQSASSHSKGHGCPNCGGNKNYSEEDVIRIVNSIYGDSYNLSKLKYKSFHEKMIIIEPIYQTEHLLSLTAIKKNTKCNLHNAVDKNDYIIKQFKNKHGNIYDYSKVNYQSATINVKIICKEHGEFEQTPSSHKSGAKCPKCQGLVVSNEDILEKFKEVHGDTYNYSKVDYKSAKSKVTIICKIHGEFEQSAYSHFISQGCPKCQGLVVSNEDILEKFKEVHGDTYNYSKVDYKSAKSKVTIICKIHGEFEQTANNHIYGNGCFICNVGWGKQKIINFINNIRNEDVLNMDPVELNMLIAQGKLPKEFEELVFTLEGTKENSLKTLKENLGIGDRHELSDSELENLSDKLESMTMSSYDDEINDALVAIETISDEDLEFSRQEERKSQGLPSISNDDILVLDKELINTCDDEAVEFFIQYKLKRVWNEIINDKRDVKDIKDLDGGKNSTRLRDLFLSEYKKVVDYIPPTGYNFKRNGEIALPNMMQKLTVQRVIDYKRYGNWSGTGAGKTISFIIASREVNSRLTIVICINSTVSQLEEDILDVYPDSKIFTHFRKGQKFNRDNYNYLLLNYEKFQQGYTEEIFQDLNENNLIDFIVLDEVHNAKQRDKDESIRRGALMRLIGRSAEMNPNFHLLGMSATPVINNLIEAKSLLQLITGKDYDDISTRGTITNALKIFNQLLLNGIRYIPKYDIVLKELTAENTSLLNIDGTKLTEKLKDNDNKDYLGLEKILLESKLEVLEEFLKPKTIIYTYFTDNDKIPKRIAKYVKSKGYSCGLYIGEQSTEDREHSKTSFVKGDVDILIASRIIGTGVDGLQNVCNRMILLTLPWTDSEYTQLKGRIYRQGSKFGDVEIVIPQVFVDLDDKRWSWDKQRLQLIREKRTLADAAVDGIIPSKHVPSREKLCSDSLQALKKWKIRVSEGKITTIERNDLVLPLRPEILEYLKPSLGDFSEMNKSWSISRSENTKNRLIKDPSEWYYYHSLYAEKRKEWSEIPYIEIAKKIKERPEWVVADMGCGENLLSKELTNQVHAFDYVAIDKNVIACDMSSVPLNSQEVDAVVFCLSLMGSNYQDYLKEAFRIIKPYGNLFICEPKKKIDNRIEDFKKDIESVGFKIIEVNSHSSKFIYFQGIKL